jgi:hypothetical protein
VTREDVLAVLAPALRRAVETGVRDAFDDLTGRVE